MSVGVTTVAIQARALATDLAQQVAVRLRQASPEASDTQEKAFGDWVSAWDRQTEAWLRKEIARAFPGHAFVGEESAGAEPLSPYNEPEWCWLVDPIDGSMNFLRGYPQYAVSIALLHHGEPVAGVIADPTRGEVFSAAAGQGATLDGRPLQVAPTQALGQAVAGTVFPKPHAAALPGYLEQLGRVMATTAGVRRSGAMTLELAYLAAGRLDAFWALDMGAWDAAAGVLLIREAGGEVFTLDGRHWLLSRAVAAAAPGVAQAWRELLQGGGQVGA